jgi:hypothetical protein
MKKQIKDLEPWEVDCLVAKAEGFDAIVIRNNECYIANWKYSPTTNPSQAWPIIERENIYISKPKSFPIWYASINNYNLTEGRSMLEAAMRCYVASKFGGDVEL